MAGTATLFASTIRSPPYTYLHLTLLDASSLALPAPAPVDILTVQTRLLSALSQSLGLAGTAIPIDILKLSGRDVWLRVPSGDGGAVVEAVSGWAGDGEAAWRVRGRSAWLGALLRGGGRDVFRD